MKPKFLLLGPPVVWAVAGLVLLFDRHRALDYFPYLWIANDIALIVAVGGLFMMLLGSGDVEPSPVDEWTDFKGAADDARPVEELLAEIAKVAEREGGP